jgi:single-strand DNA-binding protein
MNVAVVEGILSSAPRERTLPSGSEVVQWEVTIRRDGAASSVPVQWLDPPDRVRRCREGDRVVVLGTIRRRFYRAAGATASRTEVVGERMARPANARSVDRLLDAARDRLSA